MRPILFSILLYLLLIPLAGAKTVKVTSPDGQIAVSISDDHNTPDNTSHYTSHYTPHYQVSYRGQKVINVSRLGIAFKKIASLGAGFSINGSRHHYNDQSWQQPWGERQTVRDHHNRLTVNFSHGERRFSVEFKVFNDGFGFRYQVPQQPGMMPSGDTLLEITDELTEFVIDQSDKATAWWIPSRGWNRYEYVYRTTPLHQAALAHTPFTLKTAAGVYLSIHEAALVDYAAMSLDQRRPGTFKADLSPWSDGIRVKTRPGFKTPWRTVQISPDAVGLLNSDLILNLNEPNKLGDMSWVEPGKYVGIWWGMHIGKNTWGSGKKHGATTSEAKRYIDFAADNGFAGVLIEGWNIGWDGDWFHHGELFDFTKAYPDFDLAAVTAYGKQKAVRLIGHHETSGDVNNYKKQMADAFALYQRHGVRQVKTGYVADGGGIDRIDDYGIARKEWHDGQFMVGEYLHSVTEAAKVRISINSHEPVKDTGLRRTYPNWITREGARGMEYNAWGTPPNPPEHTTILPYTRMLSGPMDFTPGIFDMGFSLEPGSLEPDSPEPVKSPEPDSPEPVKSSSFEVYRPHKPHPLEPPTDEEMKDFEPHRPHSLEPPTTEQLKEYQAYLLEQERLEQEKLEPPSPEPVKDQDDINRPRTTLAKQLALYVVIYSPIQMAADLPKNYLARPDAFQFIKDVPTDWQDSRAIAGEIGDYVVFARQERNGYDWYLGAISDEKARKLTLKLDFLTPGEKYQAQIYRDGAKADWQRNPYDMIIESKIVDNRSTLELPLATSGGAAIRFKAL